MIQRVMGQRELYQFQAAKSKVVSSDLQTQRPQAGCGAYHMPASITAEEYSLHS